MTGWAPRAAITAIVYANGEDIGEALRRVVRGLAASGLVVAGFVQREARRADRSRCDMFLEDLTSGATLRISEDRGDGARGCRLVVSELLRAATLAEQALATGPDILVLNKFGKTEAEGGGARQLIAAAMARNVPVLIAVPERNLESWRAFAGELSVELRVDALADDASILNVLGVVGTGNVKRSPAALRAPSATAE